MENAQRRATRLVPALRGLSYTERLQVLNLPSMDYRRKRFDMIQVYKIIHGIDDIDMNVFFKFAGDGGTRGHTLKLLKPQAKKSSRLNSFSHRTITIWNDLPQDVVSSGTVCSFKSKLDKLWSGRRFDVSEVY